MQGCIPLTQWQVGYIGPLPRSEGAMFALMVVYMVTGLSFSWPSGQENQCAMIHALTVLKTLYSQRVTIESDQGIHFIGLDVQ